MPVTLAVWQLFNLNLKIVSPNTRHRLICVSGGFSQMYAYVCDWLGFPYREEVQWVSVSVCVCVHAHTRSPTLIYTVIRTRPHSYTYMHTRTPTHTVTRSCVHTGNNSTCTQTLDTCPFLSLCPHRAFLLTPFLARVISNLPGSLSDPLCVLPAAPPLTRPVDVTALCFW